MPRTRAADHVHVPVPVPPPPGLPPPRTRLGPDDPRGPKGETYVRCRICGKRYWVRLDEAKPAEPEPVPEPEPAPEAEVESPAEPETPARRTRAARATKS